MALSSDYYHQKASAPDVIQWMTKAAFALVVAYVTFLAISSHVGAWLVDPHGEVRQNDFVAFWAAGRMALEGQAASAYDWSAHKVVEELAVGHSFDKYFGWFYPPTFLPVVVLLASLPYLIAFFTWIAFTLSAYVFVVRSIIGHRAGILLACAFPAVLWNVSVGQNGFLTAALLGGTMLTMEKRPVLAGILLGLLTYKPQLGVLFPLLLVAGGHWRVFAVATVTTLLLIAGSWGLFGTSTWLAFFDQLGTSNEIVLNEGMAGFHKLQTVFGLTRWCGGSEALAWGLHLLAAAAAGISVVVLWMNRRVAYDLKAAAAGTAALVVTPYLHLYDLIVLAIPLAFLIRHGLRTQFLPYDVPAIAVISACVFAVPVTGIPLGALAIVIVGAMICRHIAASTETSLPRLFSPAVAARH